MRDVAGRLRLEMSQFRAMAAFAQFGRQDLDAATHRQLDRGERLTEILKQPEHVTIPVENQATIFYLATAGHLDDVEVGRISAFERGWYEYAETNTAQVLRDIRESGALSEENQKKLGEAVTVFKQTFAPQAGA